MVIPEGTLVQVKQSATKRNINSYINREMTTENGWLWIVEKHWLDGAYKLRPMYECRSLATGRIATWIDNEITVKEQDNGES